jgi:hypothetical protein
MLERIVMITKTTMMMIMKTITTLMAPALR